MPKGIGRGGWQLSPPSWKTDTEAFKSAYPTKGLRAWPESDPGPQAATEESTDTFTSRGRWAHYNNNSRGDRRERGRLRIGGPFQQLPPVQWQGVELVRVQKDFLVSHPRVEERTEEEAEMIRCRAGIMVEGPSENMWDIPKPVKSLEEAPFPDWAEIVMKQRGWTEPTPIQIQGWPAVLRGHDVIGIAATGSGKSMVYILPMLVHIMAQPELKPGEGPIGLILVPSRELCDQVAKETQAFSSHIPGMNCLTIKGGEDGRKQEAELVERADIVVATPGRLIHHLNKQMTNLRRTTYVVLDEADELLAKGFEAQTKLLMTQIRPDRQVLLFSATWEEDVEKYAKEICKVSPITITVGCKRLAACKDIDQVFACPGFTSKIWKRDEPKTDALCRAVQLMLSMRSKDHAQKSAKALIFCNTVESVHEVVQVLRDANLPGEGFTRENGQDERNSMMERFRDPNPDELPVLVSTSALGRGHDFRNVKYVINYDMPNRLVEYVHRIGRTGRAGNRGFALTLLDKLDLRYGKDLVECLRETLHPVPRWLEREAKKYKWYWHQYWDQYRIGWSGEGGWGWWWSQRGNGAGASDNAYGGSAEGEGDENWDANWDSSWRNGWEEGGDSWEQTGWEGGDWDGYDQTSWDGGGENWEVQGHGRDHCNWDAGGTIGTEAVAIDCRHSWHYAKDE